MGVSGDTQALHRLADELRALGDWAEKDMAPALAREVERLVRFHFTSGTDAEGRPWAAPIRGGAPLRDSEKLMNSFSTSVEGKGFLLESSLFYAGVHNEGATIRAKQARGLRFRVAGRWVTKQQVEIPRRAFLPSPDVELPSLWHEAMREVVEVRLRRLPS